MKKFSILVVVVLVVGFLVFGFKNKKSEAPAEIRNDAQESSVEIPPFMPPVQDKDQSATDSPTSAAVKEFTISGQNFSFTPNLITVKKGDKVKITFQNTAGFHDFVIDEYGASTKQTQAPTTEVLEFTADKLGSFEYYCSVGSHRSMGMFGTLTVTE
jgi:plastocyanin